MSGPSGIGGKRLDSAGFRPVSTGTGDPRARQRAAVPSTVSDDAALRRPREQRDRQFVMIDGQQLDRNAPRGTYLNVLI
ncbi:hypothetical protein [Novispirillum itersonii]|uniref:Uncharacterized protein n=1 Tax=Novispirillum itersonii TaxID=189 RepID=A0A7X0DN02_NOVIT|nr:hypothetical protein [Novispirillum itersonii]MBB6210829.1 hypothetical protein [Novispirillum itersonii]